jgi:hypothetical protein
LVGSSEAKKVPGLVRFFCEIFCRVFELPSSPRNAQKREKKIEKKSVLDFLQARTTSAIPGLQLCPEVAHLGAAVHLGVAHLGSTSALGVLPTLAPPLPWGCFWFLFYLLACCWLLAA